MERVQIRHGKAPVLIFAPHGYDDDDENTALIAEHIAKTLNCYAVVNKGWERADVVDCFKDKGDCNNATQIHNDDVLKSEILDPLLRCYHKIKRVHQTVYMFNIHGMSDRHRKLSGNSHLDIVVGFGAGSPNSYTCDLWRKNLFIYLLHKAGMTTFEGKAGGSMSGWSRNNMNQLFRKWYPDKYAQVMQLEIIHELRADPETSLLCAEYIADCISNLITAKEFTAPIEFDSY